MRVRCFWKDLFLRVVMFDEEVGVFAASNALKSAKNTYKKNRVRHIPR